MKKKIIIITLIGVLFIGLITYFVLSQNNDATKFKKDYEKYNNLTYQDGENQKKYENLKIDKDNPIVYLTKENLMSELSKGEKLFFIASPNDNNSRTAIPTLLKALKENGIEKIYYYDAISLDDDLKNELIKKINEDTKEKDFNLPLFMLIKKGRISTYQIGIDTKSKDNLYSSYEDIVLSYIMCSEDC